MAEIGALAGVVGLCIVPMLLGRLFGDKELLAAILSTVLASALLLYARIFKPDLATGVFVVYICVVFISICTSGYRHTRRDGGGDRRYSEKNNPFFWGLFSGASWRAIIAIVITQVYHGITSGDWGLLGLLSGFFGGFFIALYQLFKPLFQ
jgi:hypothetical protein